MQSNFLRENMASLIALKMQSGDGEVEPAFVQGDPGSQFCEVSFGRGGSASLL